MAELGHDVWHGSTWQRRPVADRRRVLQTHDPSPSRWLPAPTDPPARCSPPAKGAFAGARGRAARVRIAPHPLPMRVFPGGSVDGPSRAIVMNRAGGKATFRTEWDALLPKLT
jgi:hypothetical protein